MGQLHQRFPDAHCHIRLDAAGQYASNLEAFLRQLPFPHTLSVGEPLRNARYRLRRRISDFIETNLGNQDLSPRKIAASSRISLSYLYSLFNDDNTTVSQFIQVRRLQRAYELLVADPKGHLTVSEIAYEVGFKNVSHFSRTFSRQFGMAPREAHQLARPLAPGSSVPLSAGTADRAGAGAFAPGAWSAAQQAM